MGIEELSTDFDGRFEGQLMSISTVTANYSSEFSGTSSRYKAFIKIKYQRDLMGLLEEGMLIAIRNFKSRAHNGNRFTLMSVAQVWPEHFGLKGVSGSSYIPTQFEIATQAVPDWETDDNQIMAINMVAIPVNYDIIIEGKKPIFKKGFTYPIIGERVYILNRDTIDDVYNSKIKERLGFTSKRTVADPYIDPRIGTISMFEALPGEIPIYVDFEALVRYHFGIFSFTGGGKSNLLSNIIRRIMIHKDNIKVIVFDVSSEYPAHLMDVLGNPDIPSRIILDTNAESFEQFSKMIATPRRFEGDPRVAKGLRKIWDLNRVYYMDLSEKRIPTYFSLINQLESFQQDSLDKGYAHYADAAEEIIDFIESYIMEQDLTYESIIDADFLDIMETNARQILDDFGVNNRSSLYAWVMSRKKLKTKIERLSHAIHDETAMTINDIEEALENTDRLIVLSIADPYIQRSIVIKLVNRFLYLRKKHFKSEPYILFVFDEAQEFVSSARAGDMGECSMVVESLLRQGRKYGLGGCIATQRMAYLNTNAMQQLHTYFVGTLPRPYDRGVVSSTFMIDQTILEKTLEFAPGGWLLSSYIATGLENVPILMQADNSEDVIDDYLDSI